ASHRAYAAKVEAAALARGIARTYRSRESSARSRALRDLLPGVPWSSCRDRGGAGSNRAVEILCRRRLAHRGDLARPHRDGPKRGIAVRRAALRLESHGVERGGAGSCAASAVGSRARARREIPTAGSHPLARGETAPGGCIACAARTLSGSRRRTHAAPAERPVR